MININVGIKGTSSHETSHISTNEICEFRVHSSCLSTYLFMFLKNKYHQNMYLFFSKKFSKKSVGQELWTVFWWMCVCLVLARDESCLSSCSNYSYMWPWTTTYIYSWVLVISKLDNLFARWRRSIISCTTHFTKNSSHTEKPMKFCIVIINHILESYSSRSSRNAVFLI